MKKLKTYVITISIAQKEIIHTICGNYPLWGKRFLQIDKGEACLSVRVWEGVPYKSKQKEVFNFTKTDGIGLQKLENPDNFVFAEINQKNINWQLIAKNNGLTFDEFQEWFKFKKEICIDCPYKNKTCPEGCSKTESMAIIHFTSFRY